MRWVMVMHATNLLGLYMSMCCYCTHRKEPAWRLDLTAMHVAFFFFRVTIPEPFIHVASSKPINTAGAAADADAGAAATNNIQVLA